jgi:hypothetical protein
MFHTTCRRRWLVPVLLAALPLVLTGCQTYTSSSTAPLAAPATGKATTPSKPDSTTPSTGLKAPHIPGN